MEILSVRKTAPGNAELDLVIAGTEKTFQFTYENPGIVVAHFPEEFVRMIRQLPNKVAQSIVSRVILAVESDTEFLPYEIELEKEILALV